MTATKPGVSWSLAGVVFMAALGGLLWSAAIALLFKAMGWW